MSAMDKSIVIDAPKTPPCPHGDDCLECRLQRAEREREDAQRALWTAEFREIALQQRIEAMGRRIDITSAGGANSSAEEST